MGDKTYLHYFAMPEKIFKRFSGRYFKIGSISSFLVFDKRKKLL